MKCFCAIIFSLALALPLMGCAGTEEMSNRQSSLPTLEVAASSAAQPNGVSAEVAALEPTEETTMKKITIAVGGRSFSATLADNEAAKAFAAYLPMTVSMGDLNGQEKFYGLPDNLPADSTERPSTISSGDIFCWSGNTLVLFYQTFQNSYGGYVRLGSVDDPAELAAALGSGNAEVTWSLAQ